MTTNAPPLLLSAMMRWDASPRYPSASFSGIKGDAAHEGRGYHISLQDLYSQSDYSAVRVKDKAPPGKWPRDMASAGDMSMSTPDMIKAWTVFLAVWEDRADPRRGYFNAFNGWNGKGDAERLDFDANTRTVASSDHKWHSHLELHRCYVNDPTAMAALESILNGETRAQWIARNGGGQSTASTGKRSDMYIVQLGSRFVWTDGSEFQDIPDGDRLNKCNALCGGATVNTGTQAEFDWYAGVPKGYGTTLDVDLDSLAEKITAGLIKSRSNGLTPADHSTIIEDVKAALREGATTK